MAIRVHCNVGLIGDALSAMPFLHQLSQKDNVVAGPNINQWVLEGLDFPFTFDQTVTKEDSHYILDAAYSLGYCCQNPSWHMMQGHFLVNHLEHPQVPYYLPLKKQLINLEPGIVIAPFSRSSIHGNKAWSNQRWLELAGMLPDPVYVVGSSEHDNFDWTKGSKLIPVINQPMSKINSLLTTANAVITIDNGISHLCHYLGIKKHVLIYPTVLPTAFVNNPLAKRVQAWPSTISVETVYGLYMLSIEE